MMRQPVDVDVSHQCTCTSPRPVVNRAPEGAACPADTSASECLYWDQYLSEVRRRARQRGQRCAPAWQGHAAPPSHRDGPGATVPCGQGLQHCCHQVCAGGTPGCRRHARPASFVGLSRMLTHALWAPLLVLSRVTYSKEVASSLNCTILRWDQSCEYVLVLRCRPGHGCLSLHPAHAAPARPASQLGDHHPRDGLLHRQQRGLFHSHPSRRSGPNHPKVGLGRRMLLPDTAASRPLLARQAAFTPPGCFRSVGTNSGENPMKGKLVSTEGGETLRTWPSNTPFAGVVPQDKSRSVRSLTRRKGAGGCFAALLPCCFSSPRVAQIQVPLPTYDPIFPDAGRHCHRQGAPRGDWH